MGYIRKKNRSKKRKSNKNRSKKRQSYNRKRYLKGGVGSPVSSNRSTPSAASASVSSTPSYNSSFSTPSSNSTSSSAYSTPVGINLAGQFNDAHQQQQLSDNRNTGNYNSVGQWSPNSIANEYMNPPK
jgi:hypothetical protein